MGRRGPPPKPTALRLLEGDVSHRPSNSLEPKPALVMPRCPQWLSPEAKKGWRRLAPQLHRLRVLTEVDGDALAAYCQTYSRWKDAEQFIAKHGAVYPLRDDSGRIKCMQQVPQVSIARTLLLVLRAYQQEFGLTPASRSRVSMVASDRSADPDSIGERLRLKSRLREWDRWSAAPRGSASEKDQASE